MKNNFTKKIIFFSLLCLVISSCVSRKEIVYFNQGENNKSNVYENFMPTIKPGDMLSIVISALDIEATKPFNQVNIYSNINTTNNSRNNIYIVDKNGFIEFPTLGKIKLSGITRIDAIELFKQKLNQYIVNPGVNISFVNFRITVIGDVAKPGTFTLPDERVTLLDALALAGDMNITGIRDNIQIIRETNEGKKIYTVDLTSKETLGSEVYYLQQNDVVYVEPRRSKADANTLGTYAVLTSVAGIFISLITLFTR